MCLSDTCTYCCCVIKVIKPLNSHCALCMKRLHMCICNKSTCKFLYGLLSHYRWCLWLLYASLIECTVECNNHRYCSNISLCGHFNVWCFILLWLWYFIIACLKALYCCLFLLVLITLKYISSIKKKRIQIFPIRILLGRIVVAGLSPLCLPLAMEPTPPAQQSRWVSVCVYAHVLSVVPLCCINPQIHACLFGIAFDPKP